MTTVKVQEQYVIVNNLKLRYLDWGASERPAMVCLHGHGLGAHIWDEFAEAMAPYYHVYALDQRGHGGSQWAADGYDRDRFVEDLGRFLDALGIFKATLVGHSMGGWNSLLYASSSPGRVERVILVDIGPEPSEASRRQVGTRPPRPLDFDGFEEALAWARQGDSWATEQRLRRHVEGSVRQGANGKWLWQADPTLLSTPLRDMQTPESIARYWRCLETITCPILEVRGKESVAVDDAILERMARANPRFSYVDVAGAGHSVTVDKPREFIAATRAFLGVPG
ncbi:MAG: alpha/beta hydrolase [Dehalococcoidia bacterium]|nr:alpha/beta hydrolase [Dehalococcoidia bacterium]